MRVGGLVAATTLKACCRKPLKPVPLRGAGLLKRVVALRSAISDNGVMFNDVRKMK